MGVSLATLGFATLIKMGDGGVGAGSKANVEWGASNTKIRIKWKANGTVGNGKNITVVVSGSSFVYTTLDSTAISITAPTTATVAQVIANLYQQANFDTYWDADFGATPGDGSGTITARTVTATSGGTNGTEVFATIAEVGDISGPSREAGLVEVTHQESPNFFKEYIPGLLDSGTITFPMNFINSAAQLAVFTAYGARTKTNFQLVSNLATGSKTDSFAGYITNVEMGYPKEGAITANVTIKITGPIS